MCQPVGRLWPCHFSFCDNQGADDEYSQTCVTVFRRELSNIQRSTCDSVAWDPKEMRWLKKWETQLRVFTVYR